MSVLPTRGIFAHQPCRMRSASCAEVNDFNEFLRKQRTVFLPSDRATPPTREI
jgi:hypothetical protein